MKACKRKIPRGQGGVTPPQSRWMATELPEDLERRGSSDARADHLRVLLQDFRRCQDGAADELSAPAGDGMYGRLRQIERRVGRDKIVEGVLQGFVRGEECARRGDGNEDDGADTLIETSEQRSICRAICIFVKPLIIFRLQSGLERVQGVNKEVDGEGSKSSSLEAQLERQYRNPWLAGARTNQISELGLGDMGGQKASHTLRGYEECIADVRQEKYSFGCWMGADRNIWRSAWVTTDLYGTLFYSLTPILHTQMLTICGMREKSTMALFA